MPSASPQTIPSDGVVRAILEPRVDSGRFAGLIVGLIAPDGRYQVTGYGPNAGVSPFDANTVFEIGSITKTFTAAVLADMINRKEVALYDPVVTHLPPGTKIPDRDGRQITLLDLATQTSGLPRLPRNLVISSPRNPYAEYAPAQMYEFLSAYMLPRGIGEQYEYTNLGYGLLGQALSYRAGRDYESLVIERLLTPLGMLDTKISLTQAMHSRVAPGHDQSGDMASLWDLPTFAGSGAFRSTMSDMLRYIRANADPSSTPLGSVLAATHVRQRPTNSPRTSIGLAWHRTITRSRRTIVWHNGGTGGYRAFTGFDEETRLGVVVLANTAVGVDDIGMHLLDASIPLAPIVKQRVAIEVAPDILQRYVGRYELTPTFNIVITRQGSALYAQPTGQRRFQLFPETEARFFLRAVDAQVTFTTDTSGVVTGLVVHQNGRNRPGRKS